MNACNCGECEECLRRMLDASNERADRLFAKLRAIELATTGEGEVREGEYAWTPELGRVREMYALLNAPEILDFAKAIKLEAAHQRQRWGSAHDEGKSDAEWYWLIGWLGAAACERWAISKGKEAKVRAAVESLQRMAMPASAR